MPVSTSSSVTGQRTADSESPDRVSARQVTPSLGPTRPTGPPQAPAQRPYGNCRSGAGARAGAGRGRQQYTISWVNSGPPEADVLRRIQTASRTERDRAKKVESAQKPSGRGSRRRRGPLSREERGGGGRRCREVSSQPPPPSVPQ